MALKWLSRRMSLGAIQDFEGIRESDSPQTSPKGGRRSSRALLLRPRAFLRANLRLRSSDKMGSNEKLGSSDKLGSCDKGSKPSEETRADSVMDVQVTPPGTLPEEVRHPSSMPQIDEIHSEVPAERHSIIGSAAEFSRKCVSTARSLVWDDKSEEGTGIKKITNIEDIFALKEQVQPPSNDHVKVLFARQVTDNQPVVVKVIQKKFFALPGEEKEWRRNAELMLKLKRSRFICQIFSIYEDKLAYYVSMERVTGQDLYEVLTSKEPLNQDDLKEVIRQILCGIRDLHTTCIHRDMKLENVMLARVRRGGVFIKIIDFDTIQCTTAAEKPTKGRKVTIVGTDQYISPEAYEGSFSKASDIFAVGVIAYILCSRKFPFQHKMFDDKPGENYVGSPKMHQIADRVREANLNWEKDFKDNTLGLDFCKQLMCLEPEERPSAEEALEHPWLDERPAFGKALSMF
ncbi:unnamed protein product [Effrenium voratum]|nr:unnamed protein product [Effrenium voratum]